MTDKDFDEDLSIPETAASDRYRADDGALRSQDDLYRYRPWEEHRDDEGYLHHDTKPAARGKDGVLFYMKHGYAHKANGPAAKVGYIDAPEYWYFYEGKCLGKNEEGWIELWRITKNKDLFRRLEDTGPNGERIHDLKNLANFITQDDFSDEDGQAEDLFHSKDLFYFIWPQV